MRALSIGTTVLIVGLLLVAPFFLVPNNVTVFLGLTSLGILIPLAVDILADVLQAKKNKEEADFADLDPHVILDHIFSIKQCTCI